MASNVRVHFVDGSYKSMLVDVARTTVEELWREVVTKLELGPAACRCFYLWAYGADDVATLLRNDDTLEAVFREWPALEARYRPEPTTLLQHLRMPRLQASKEPPRLVLRTTAVLGHDLIEASLSEPKALWLHYLQAVDDVVHSNYPVDEDSAVEVAALQLQVAVGNWVGTTHTAGYLCQGKAPALALYMPAVVLRKRSKKAMAVLEERIFAEWRRHADQSAHDMMAQYLSIVKAFPSFGSTFFKVHHESSDSKVFSQKFEGEISLGISQTGVHLLDTGSLSGKAEIQFVAHSEIATWGCDARFFWFGLVDPSKGQVVFSTRIGDMLRDLLSQWKEELKDVAIRSPRK